MLEEIGGYAYEHPEMKTALSYRSNFRRERQLELFTELFLEELSIGDVIDYAAKREVNSDGFMRSIFANQLGDFMKNPFFLSVLIDAYKEKGKQFPKDQAGTTYYSDLMCLCCFLNWDDLKSDSNDLTEKLFSVLEKKTAESLEKED